MIDLAEKHVLVTGASGGIGTEIVAIFKKAGAKVSAFDLDENALKPLDVAFGAGFDMRDGEAAESAVKALVAAQGVPDILVNNAGWSRADSFAVVDRKVWQDEVAVNLHGTFNITDPVLAGMVARGSGTLLFIDSVNGLGYFGNPAYSAGKAGVLSYMKSIAVEYGAKGIRSNAVCPGSVRTPAWDHRIAADPSIVENLKRFYPLGRIVEPREVAAAAFLLCSPLASGITGVALPVDAGLTAGSLPFIRDILGTGA